MALGGGDNRRSMPVEVQQHLVQFTEVKRIQRPITPTLVDGAPPVCGERRPYATLESVASTKRKRSFFGSPETVEMITRFAAIDSSAQSMVGRPTPRSNVPAAPSTRQLKPRRTPHVFGTAIRTDSLIVITPSLRDLVLSLGVCCADNTVGDRDQCGHSQNNRKEQSTH
jgi:hypothetical protein